MSAEQQEKAFWESRRTLTTIRDGAWARYASPWAVLGNVLARLAAAQGPSLKLPGIVGGEASLNTFVAIVGPSGSGKGAARSAARELLVLPEEPFTIPLGSGEGLVGVFVEPGTREATDPATGAVSTVPCPRLIRTSAVAVVDEVDHLVAVGQGRAGSTIMSTLRQAWSGETFGRTTAARDRNLWVQEGQYGLGLVVGVQPLRAGPLLDDSDGGTPQRFLWLPATDPCTPDRTEEPQPVRWTRPHRSTAQHMGVPETARAAIVQDRLRRIRGEDTGLDGHALLARLKAAACLALLEGRRDVTDEDWDLSAAIMAVSDRTRAEVQKALDQRAVIDSEKRAKAAGHAEVVKEEVMAAETLRRLRGVIIRKLTASPDWTPRSEVRRSVQGKDRADFEAALLSLLADGTVHEREGQRGLQVRLAER